jgi:hypothetical protein
MTSARAALGLSVLCALAACDHQNEPPATPAAAATTAPSDAAAPPEATPPVEPAPTKPEKDSNDGSGSSSPIPGGSNELKAPVRG